MLGALDKSLVEMTKLNQQDVAPARIMAQMAELFAIDAKARDQSIDHFLITLERASVLSDLAGNSNQ
jgi:hypothetical protein